MEDAPTQGTAYGATDESQPLNQERLKAIGNQLVAEGTQIGFALFQQGKNYADSVSNAPKGLSYLSTLGGMCMMVTAVLGLMWRSGTVKSLVQVYFFIFGGTILVLEMSHGMFAKPEYKAFLHEYFHFVFTLYGRGLFYIFCTSLLLAQWPFVPDVLVGLFMGFLSVIYTMVGLKSQAKLKKMSIANDEEASAMFVQHDVNKDGLLDRDEFKALLATLEIEMTEQETDAAMLSIDKQSKGSITSEEFLDFYTHSK